MIKRIKNFLLVGLMGLALTLPLAPAGASAACTQIAKDVSKGASGAATGNAVEDCGTSQGVDDNAIVGAARGIVNLISIIVGIIAIIMIIYGGFRYITSGGDSGRVGNAKNTLIYAIVGLIIVALAQIIVRFVLTQSAELTT